MKEKFNEKVIPVILKFINTKAIQSIKNGMVTSMSPLIIGSIFLILSNFPIKAVVDVLESTGIKPVLDQVCGATFSISALIADIIVKFFVFIPNTQFTFGIGLSAVKFGIKDA